MSAAEGTAGVAPTSAGSIVSPAEERRVILASSIGTVFEWYDFYLYAVLAPFFAVHFFPTGNPTAALLSAFVTYAAGFLVRPFGAIVFGRIGDLVGRKYTFLITISVMGASTFLVGCLPTFNTVKWLAPTLLTLLRLAQGLALGGEYGGAATYVAEHSPIDKRGGKTSWIQTTATVGLLLALIVIIICRLAFGDKKFGEGYWRVPFLLSAVLLAFSIYIRLKLNESPVFRRMKEEGRGSKHPLTESFFHYPNNKYVALALFGATAGQGVVWYTGQFQALFFMQNTLKLHWLWVYLLIGSSLVIGTPFFILFGRLSDRIGRLKIILAGCLIAAVTYIPLFKGLTHYVNPALEAFQDKNLVSVAAPEGTCSIHIFRGPWTKFTGCDNATDYLTALGINFNKTPVAEGQPAVLKIGDTEFPGWEGKGKDLDAVKAKALTTLKAAGYPTGADKNAVNVPMVLLLLVIMVIYVTMVYGPIAAYLVELFPTKIRYTSMSLPYHLGNGWFGGMLPLLFVALVAVSGDPYRGLWYPIIVSLMTLVVGLLFLRETPKTFDIHA
jgi:MFS family permease